MAKPFQLHGLIVRIEKAEIRGNFEKRVFELKEKDTERYPQYYSLECQQNDVNILDNFSIGDEVSCWVDIRGKLWENNGKRVIFHTLKCYKIEKVNSLPSSYKPVPAVDQSVNSESVNWPGQNDDDLPF